MAPAAVAPRGPNRSAAQTKSGSTTCSWARVPRGASWKTTQLTPSAARSSAANSTRALPDEAGLREVGPAPGEDQGGDDQDPEGVADPPVPRLGEERQVVDDGDRRAAQQGGDRHRHARAEEDHGQQVAQPPHPGAAADGALDQDGGEDRLDGVGDRAGSDQGRLPADDRRGDRAADGGRGHEPGPGPALDEEQDARRRARRPARRWRTRSPGWSASRRRGRAPCRRARRRARRPVPPGLPRARDVGSGQSIETRPPAPDAKGAVRARSRGVPCAGGALD